MKNCIMCDAPSFDRAMCPTCEAYQIALDEENLFDESSDYPDDYSWEFGYDEGDIYAGTYSEM